MGLVPVAPGVPVGQSMSYSETRAMHESLSIHYRTTQIREAQIRQAQLNAQAQAAENNNSGFDPSLMGLFGNLFKANGNTPIVEYTPEDLDRLVAEGRITEAEKRAILSRKKRFINLPDGTRVNVHLVRTQDFTEDLEKNFKAEPRPDLCKRTGHEGSDISVEGFQLPCAGINESLELINTCEGAFPNKSYIVVNDYSNSHGGHKSFRSWIIPIARDPKTNKFVMATKTNISTGEQSGPRSYPLSNGKMYKSGLFCSAGGENQTPLGFHLTNIGHHPGRQRIFECSGVDCNLPGVPKRQSPKIGMVGIEPGHNNNSLNRGILIHMGTYAGKPGATEGCSVVTREGVVDMWNTVGGDRGGALVNNYGGPPDASTENKVCGKDKKSVNAFRNIIDPAQKCEAIRRAARAQGGTESLVAKMNTSPTPAYRIASEAPVRAPAGTDNLRTAELNAPRSAPDSRRP